MCLSGDAEIQDEAVLSTARLLESANCDLAAWQFWLKTHKLKPYDHRRCDSRKREFFGGNGIFTYAKQLWLRQGGGRNVSCS